MPRFRPILDTMPAYKPGKTVMTPDGRSYKLSSNETPYEPLPSVVEAIAEGARQIHRYPDPAAVRLTEAIAARHGVPAEHIALGAGSVTVAQQLFESIGDPGVEVVYAWRSFEAYPVAAQVAGATRIEVPLTPDARLDLDAMAERVTDRTRAILVCTPNNPTGPVVHHDELAAFLARVPTDVLVLVDEAYLEFVRDPNAADALALYREHPNVCLLRTFSKAYCLANLRVGYAIAHEPVADALRACAPPFAVSSLAEEAALAALACEDVLLAAVERLVEERRRVAVALREYGFDVPATEANFVWLPLGDEAEVFAAACEAEGVIVRTFAGDGCRISIGEQKANDLVLEVAARWASSRGLSSRDHR